MSDAVVPAVVALTGGTAALASIYVHERAIERARRESSQAYRLSFPKAPTEREAIAAHAALGGVGPGYEWTLETRATERAIEHFVHLPADIASGARHQLQAAAPGLRSERVEEDSGARRLATLSLRLSIPRLSLLRSDAVESASRAILSQLAQLKPGEEVRVYLSLRPEEPRLPERDPQTAIDRDRLRRLRSRVGQPTFAVAGLVVVSAGSKPRAQSLIDGVGQAWRSRSAYGRPPRLVYDRAAPRLGTRPRASRHSAAITAAEVAGLAGWPLGEAFIAQVERGATREMLVPRDAVRVGVPIFVGRDVSGERVVALPPAAQRLHTYANGPTGSGKSTFTANLVLNALAAGQAGLVVDGKDGSLNQSIADRVPDEFRDRVIVHDPAEHGAPVGLDLFAAGDADTRAEAITAVLRSVFSPLGAWGVRSDHYISLAIRSLAALEQPSLLLIGRLLTDPALRQRVVARLNDPILEMAWRAYDDLGPEAQRDHTAAPLNRLLSLLQRPPVRAAIAQPQPKLNLGEAWQRGYWVLVNLSPGNMGDGAARLLGAIYGFLAWSTLEARASIPEPSRISTNLVFDELHALRDVPVSLERMAERARAYRGQLVLTTQATSQMPRELAEAVFGNFANILTFKPGATEATRLARELPGLTADDLMALPAYGVAARVATGEGTGVVTITGRTEALPPKTGNAAYIRQRSAELYGTPRAELEQAIREQVGGDLNGSDRPAPGRARRSA